MKSNIFGESKKDTENLVEFEFDNIIINLDLENCKSSKEELLEKIENAYKNRNLMYEKIAEKLVEIKNKYGQDEENDKILTKEEFIANMKLLYLMVNSKEVYMELDDGDMFSGHRIHGYFDWNLNLKKADF